MTLIPSTQLSPTKYDTAYAYKNTRDKEQNDTHIFVTYILNTLRRFTVCYCCEKGYEKYRGLRWCENGLG